MSFYYFSDMDWSSPIDAKRCPDDLCRTARIDDIYLSQARATAANSSETGADHSAGQQRSRT